MDNRKYSKEAREAYIFDYVKDYMHGDKKVSEIALKHGINEDSAHNIITDTPMWKIIEITKQLKNENNETLQNLSARNGKQPCN